MPSVGTFHLDLFLMEVWLHITEKVELRGPEITLEFTLNVRLERGPILYLTLDGTFV